MAHLENHHQPQSVRQDMAALRDRPLTITPIRSLKGRTWYYGVHCACTRSLALTEDCFVGSGDEMLVLPMPVTVNCECGAVTDVQVLHKFKTL